MAAINCCHWFLKSLLFYKAILSPSVTAAYESVQKRTFLPMAITIAIYLPFLLGLILLYSTLGRRQHELQGTEQQNQKYKSESGEDSSETFHLVSANEHEDNDSYE